MPPPLIEGVYTSFVIALLTDNDLWKNRVRSFIVHKD